MKKVADNFIDLPEIIKVTRQVLDVVSIRIPGIEVFGETRNQRNDGIVRRSSNFIPDTGILVGVSPEEGSSSNKFVCIGHHKKGGRYKFVIPSCDDHLVTLPHNIDDFTHAIRIRGYDAKKLEVDLNIARRSHSLVKILRQFPYNAGAEIEYAPVNKATKNPLHQMGAVIAVVIHALKPDFFMTGNARKVTLLAAEEILVSATRPRLADQSGRGATMGPSLKVSPR